MWKQVFEFFKLAIIATEELKKVQSDIKEMQQQIRDLTANQVRMQFELQLLKEQLKHEREKQVLLTEIEQLRGRGQLLPSSSEEKSDK